MPDEVLAEKVRKLEVGLAALQLEVSELRANLLGPTSPFNLVLREVSEIRITLAGIVIDQKAQGEWLDRVESRLDGHGKRLDSIETTLGQHTETLAQHGKKLDAQSALLVRIAAKLGVAND